MAAPQKKKLLYFPFDVDTYEDEKITDLSMTYGPLGEAIFIRLLCFVYNSDNGYYYEFTSLDRLAMKLIKSIGNRWIKDKKTVIDVILYLCEINLFSAELMQRNVITSRGLQKRYLKATERRQSKIEKYSLLEKDEIEGAVLELSQNTVSVAETGVNVTETGVNVCNNDTKKSKVNKRKVNETERQTPQDFSAVELSDPEREELVRLSDRLTVEAYIRKLSEWQVLNRRRSDKPYVLLRQWIDEDRSKNHSKRMTSNVNPSYDLDEWERLAINGPGVK